MDKSVFQHVRDFFIKRPVMIKDDVKAHRNIILRGLIAAAIYSIAYGVYEYFVVYNGIDLMASGILVEEINWSIMYGGIMLTMALATLFNIEQMIMGLFFMTVFEDLTFWMCQWVHLGNYPFPADNWWDSYFASFRVLGGLGQPLPFFPFVPLYYIPGFVMVIGYYCLAFYRPLTSRISFTVIGPLFLAIIGGAVVGIALEQAFPHSEIAALIMRISEIAAIMMLVTFPAVSYGYVGTMYLLKRQEIGPFKPT